MAPKKLHTRRLRKDYPQYKDGHPKKPMSAYNIFFRSESKRLRDKERSRAKFMSLIQEKDPSYMRMICAAGIGERQNATQSIARKWKDHKEDFVGYFDTQGKELLDDYRKQIEIFEASQVFLCSQKQAPPYPTSFHPISPLKNCHKEVILLLG